MNTGQTALVALLIIPPVIPCLRGQQASSPEFFEARIRPVLMTSFAFILGLVPLVIATGAGAASRHAVGTPVFGGMIFAAIFGVFLIPMLYVVFQWMREKVSGAPEPAPAHTHGPAPDQAPARDKA